MCVIVEVAFLYWWQQYAGAFWVGLFWALKWQWWGENGVMGYTYFWLQQWHSHSNFQEAGLSNSNKYSCTKTRPSIGASGRSRQRGCVHACDNFSAAFWCSECLVNQYGLPKNWETAEFVWTGESLTCQLLRHHQGLQGSRDRSKGLQGPIQLPIAMTLLCCIICGH